MKVSGVVFGAVALVLSHGVAIAGDVGAGKSAYAAKGCIGCHGADGKKPIANYPVIGGKPADFIKSELTKFRSKERVEPTMNAMAAGLTDADIDNLAAYLGSL